MRGARAASWQQYLVAVATVGLTSGFCFALRDRLQTTDVAMLYLLAIVVAASWYGQRAALLATVLSIAVFDFVFVPPYYTFNVRNAAYFLTFGVMLVVALVMSRLTGRVREQAEEAKEREAQTAALYALSQELGKLTDRSEQLAAVAQHLERAVGGSAVVALVGEQVDGEAIDFSRVEGLADSVSVRVAAQWAFQNGTPAGLGTTQCAEAESLIVPLQTPGSRLGVVILTPEPGRMIPPTVLRSVEALAHQAALAIEHTMWTERHERARLEIEAERLRSALLSSLSHDLRTPLASIEGAASSLLHDAAALPTSVKGELAQTIIEESRRMTRLVANLLAMVRVETGSLAVRKAWQPLEEPLGVVLLRLEERLKPHPVTIHLPDSLPLVPIDELLIEQVFINLLENAAKYTPTDAPIKVSAWADGAAVVVEVADAGLGVPPGAEEIVFHKFYRGHASDPASGAGLGLAICRGIITAHGGRIWVQPGVPEGAAFRFTLPLEGPGTPAVPAELAHS